MQYLVNGIVYDTEEEAHDAEKKLFEEEQALAEANAKKIKDIVSYIEENIAISVVHPIEDDNETGGKYHFVCIDSTYTKSGSELYVDALIEECFENRYYFDEEGTPHENYRIKSYVGRTLSNMKKLVADAAVNGKLEEYKGLYYFDSDENTHFCIYLGADLKELIDSVVEKQDKPTEEPTKAEEVKKEESKKSAGVTVRCVPMDADWIPDIMRVLMSL